MYIRTYIRNRLRTLKAELKLADESDDRHRGFMLQARIQELEKFVDECKIGD
jgi:DNA-binding ferritin-like protein